MMRRHKKVHIILTAGTGRAGLYTWLLNCSERTSRGAGAKGAVLQPHIFGHGRGVRGGPGNSTYWWL